jgi:hypothetical protein
MPLVTEVAGVVFGSPPARRMVQSVRSGSWRRSTIGAQLPRPPRALPAPNPAVRSASAPELRARRVALLRTLAAAAARGGRGTARRVPFHGR